MKNDCKYIATALGALLLALPLAGSFAARAGEVPAASFVSDEPRGDYQDGECLDCIVSRVLDRLPAENEGDFNDLMAQLASCGEDAVTALASMLAPPQEGGNELYEYALNGLVAYVSAPGREELAPPVLKGLLASIGDCEAPETKAFLLSLTGLCATAQDAPTIAEYLSDDYLKPYAAAALASIPDTDELVLSLIRYSREPDAALAYIASVKGIGGAEKYLLRWSSSPDPLVKKNVYAALGTCGGRKALDLLSSAAEAECYAFGETNASQAYFYLIRRLVEGDNSKGYEEAGALLRSEYTAARINALDILFHSAKADRQALFLSALQDGDREFRRAALDGAAGFADDSLYAAAASMYPELTNEANTDIVTWFGERRVAGQMEVIAEASSSEYAPLALAAIHAAGRIGGDDALQILTACLDGRYAAEAEKTLMYFDGDLGGTVIALMDGSTKARIAGLHIASRRRIKQAAPKVIGLTRSGDSRVAQAAYWALAGVCTAEQFDRVCDILDNCPSPYVPAVQGAAINGGREVDFSRVAARIAASPHVERYYPLLADNGGEQAVAALVKAARDGSIDGFSSLLKVDADIVSDLIWLGATNDKWKDRAASRAVDLIGKYVPAEESAGYYLRVLDLHPSVNVTNKLLYALGDNGVVKGIGIALGYIDNVRTAPAAARAIKFIVAAHPELAGNDSVRAALLKAVEVYSSLAVSDPDAAYAVDEINSLL